MESGWRSLELQDTMVTIIRISVLRLGQVLKESLSCVRSAKGALRLRAG